MYKHMRAHTHTHVHTHTHTYTRTHTHTTPICKHKKNILVSFELPATRSNHRDQGCTPFSQTLVSLFLLQDPITVIRDALRSHRLWSPCSCYQTQSVRMAYGKLQMGMCLLCFLFCSSRLVVNTKRLENVVCYPHGYQIKGGPA